MKTKLIVVIAVVLTVLGGIADADAAGIPVVIGSNTATNLGTSLAITVTNASGVAVGNTVIVALAMTNGIGTVSAVDSQGNTYSVDKDTNGTIRTVVLSAPVTTALLQNDTITLTLPSVRAKVASAFYVNGLLSVSPVDKTAAASGSSSAPASGATATTTQADELLIGAVGFAGQASTLFTKAASFTLLSTNYAVGAANASSAGVAVEYQNVSATGAYSASGTLSASRVWSAAIVAYKALPASMLAFGVQPGDSYVNSIISPAVTVQILDQYGNLTSSNASVTLSIGNNPGSPSPGTLSGIVTKVAVNGTATFTNLSIDNVGTNYTLLASATGLTGTNSSGFTILPPDPDLPGPLANVVMVPAGSLVVPMDNVNQTNSTAFNLKSYGLVNQFLQNGIPVRWAIKAGKAKDGVDFSASAFRIKPILSAATNTVSFSGGPFIIDQTNAAAALVVITNWGKTASGTNNAVSVFQLVTNTPVDIRHEIHFKPTIAVNTANAAIDTDLLDYVGITNYVVTPDYTILPGSCISLVMEPHQTSTNGVAAIRDFVQNGGNFIAQCHSVFDYENADAGHFQFETGNAIANVATTNIYSYPDLPFSQCVGIVNAAPGGSVQDWTETGALINHAHADLDSGAGHYAASSSKHSVGRGGMVFYLGGHNWYGGAGDLADITMVNGMRMILNTIFVPANRAACEITPSADVAISKAATNSIIVGQNLTYSIAVTNQGPFGSTNLDITDTLPAGVTFVSASAPGTTNGHANSVAWNLSYLTSFTTTNLTLTVNVSPNSAAFLTNTASVTSLTDDPNATNNVSSAVVTAVLSSANLGIGKSAAATVSAMSTLAYTISVTNLGPSSASSVTVTDILTGVTFFSASGNGTLNGNEVTWNLGTLTSGQVSNVTLTVNVPANGSITNYASVGSPTDDPNQTNNVTPPVITTVTPVSDLAIGKTGAATINGTSNIVYTISVTNLGPSDAGSVTVTDVLAGVTFVSATAGGTTNGHAGVVTWNLGGLTNGEVVGITLTVQAPANGTVNNTASVGPFSNDPNTNNNVSATVTTDITPVYDVAVGKTAPGSVYATNNLTYTISVTNFGPSSASGVIVTDALPSGVTFVSATGGGTTNGHADTVTWSLGTLASGQVSNVTVTVDVPANGSVTNTASVGPLPYDTNPTNNITPPVTTDVIPVHNLAIGKTGAGNVYATSNLTYTISVTNLGPSDASGVTVTDVLAGVTFVDATGSWATNGSVVTWSLGTLTNGQVATVTLTVQVPANGAVDNAVSVGPFSNDPNTNNNVSATVRTTVTPISDLAIGKTGSSDVYATSNLTYTISVTNLGPSDAGSVTVTDLLEGVTFVTASGGGTTNGHAGVVSWNLGGLTNGEVTVVTLTVQAPANGSVNNTATVWPWDNDPNTDNNESGTVTTEITPLYNLAVGKAGAGNVYATSNLTYTISVTNLGPSDASSVTVTDVLSGVTFVAASGSWTTNGSVVTWNLGGLTNGEVESVTLTVLVPADSSGITNTASVGPLPNDPDPTNNVSPPVTTTVTPVHNLAIGKTGLASVYATNNLVYTISVTNLGPSSASSVTVTDVLAGVTFIGASSGGVWNGSVVTWDLGTLTNGQVVTLLLTNQPPANGSVTNMASVWPWVNDPNTNNNVSVPVTTTVTEVHNLAIGKTGSASVYATNNIVYTISVTNLGPSDASSVTVTDVLAGVTFVGASSGGALNGSVVTWNLGTLTNGQVVTLLLTNQPPANGSVTNVASVWPWVNDPNTNNNVSVPVTTTVTPVYDLAVGKTGAGTVAATSNLVYTISVTNLGPSSASSVTVTDALPAGVTFVSASGGGTTNGHASVVTWSLGALSSGQVSNVTVTVKTPANGSLTNWAIVGPFGNDPSTNNNFTPPVTTQVQPVADLVVYLNGPASVILGSNAVYTLTISNAGPSQSFGIIVSNKIAAGLVYQSSSPSGSFNSGNGVITWPPVSFLAVGGVTNFTFTVNAPTLGTYTNIAYAFSTNTVDPNLTNNSGVLPISQARTDVSIIQFAWGISSRALNPQTGLFEERVWVTNSGTAASAVRIFTPGLRSFEVLQNTYGTNAGQPYVLFNYPFPSGTYQSFLIEIATADRRFTPTNSIRVEITTNVVRTIPVGAVDWPRRIVSETISNNWGLEPHQFILEFPATSGRSYRVVYGDTLQTITNVIIPDVKATKNPMQWIDAGPPKTPINPTFRVYKVYQLP